MSRRIRGAPPLIVALIRKDPVFSTYIEQLLAKVESGNYTGINAGNFNRRAAAASATVGKAINTATLENEARIRAADAARLQRTRNAAAAAARNLSAARNATTAAGANRAANRAARNAEAANRAASETTGRAAASRAAANAARRANSNARAAARLAETRDRQEAASRNLAAFNTEKARWEANFAHRRAQGRSVREVIRNMAHQHLHVNIPVNGNITRVHRARIHPDRGTNKALRTVLTSRLP